MESMLAASVTAVVRHSSLDGSRKKPSLKPKFSLLFYVNKKMQVEFYIGGYTSSAQKMVSMGDSYDWYNVAHCLIVVSTGRV